MPEALVRLGELQWENARDGFVERFQDWEKKPVDQRGPAPELDYRVPRDLFARVLRDYPWFEQYDLALYVDGFLAYEQGKEDEARERFERILRDYPQSRFVPDAHMAKAEAIFNGKFDYAGRARRVREGALVQGPDRPRALRPGALQERLVLLAPRQQRRGRAALRRRLRGDRRGRRRARTPTPRSEGSSTSCRARPSGTSSRCSPRTRRTPRRTSTTSSRRSAASASAARSSARSPSSTTTSRTTSAASRPTSSCSSSSRRAATPGSGCCRSPPGYAAIEDYPHVKATFERAHRRSTRPAAPGRARRATPANVAATTAAIEKALRDDATALHARAQKDKASRAEFEGAAGLYEVYLSKFAQEPKAYEVHFDLAEIDFFRLDKNVDAATHYMAAAKAHPRRARRPGRSRRCATTRSTTRSSRSRARWT